MLEKTSCTKDPEKPPSIIKDLIVAFLIAILSIGAFIFMLVWLAGALSNQ